MNHVQAPPMPAYSPDVHLRTAAAKRAPRTLKGDVKALRGHLATLRTKLPSRESESADDEKPGGTVPRLLAPMRDRVRGRMQRVDKNLEPAYEAVQDTRNKYQGKTRPYVTSFALSSILAWVASPQILLALYERIRFGTSTTSWGFLQGPGRWFRDTLGMAWENGKMGGLIWAVVLGLAPMILLGVRNMSAGYLAQSLYRGKAAAVSIRWLTRSAYLVPILYVVGLGYPEVVSALFGAPWNPEWWQVWVAALACTTYYCTTWALDRIEKYHEIMKNGPGFVHMLLMVPLASVVTGVLLYAPGAAW